MSAPTPPGYSEHLDCLPAPGAAPLAVPTLANAFGAWQLAVADTGASPLLVCALLVQADAPLAGVLVELGFDNPPVTAHRVRLGQVTSTVIVLPLTVPAFIPPNTRLSVRAAGTAATTLRIGANVA